VHYSVDEWGDVMKEPSELGNALKALVRSLMKEAGVIDLIERIEKLERKVDLLIRLFGEWIPEKIALMLEGIGEIEEKKLETKEMAKMETPQMKPTQPTSVESVESKVPEMVAASDLEETVHEAQEVESVELPRTELMDLERQIMDLEFQKESGFISEEEYRELIKELEAKKREIEERGGA